MTKQIDEIIDFENIGIIEENEIEFPENDQCTVTDNRITANGWLFKYFDNCNSPKTRFIAKKDLEAAMVQFENKVSHMYIHSYHLAYQSDF